MSSNNFTCDGKCKCRAQKIIFLSLLSPQGAKFLRIFTERWRLNLAGAITLGSCVSLVSLIGKNLLVNYCKC